VLLYGLFNSLHDSLLALVGIPFAIAGGLLGLYASGLDFSISAAIGFISVFGISVMNGILLISYYNEVRQSGMHTVEAMFHAASQRMRSVLMTGLSACIGLFPAAISTGIGSQVQRPLATVVVEVCSSVRSCCSWSYRRFAWCFSRSGIAPTWRHQPGTTRRPGAANDG